MLRKIIDKGPVSKVRELDLRGVLLSILSAVLLALSFPGYNIWILAWVGFLPMFFAIEGRKPLSAFLLSYVTGFLFFLGTVYWLMHVTLPGMLVVVAYLALYFGFFGLIANRAVKLARYEGLLFIPASWVMLEWIRGHALTGFGWNLIGYSQSFNLPVIQIADMVGAYGVSFIILMFNAALYMMIKDRNTNDRFFMPAVITMAIFVMVSAYGVYRLNNVFTGEKYRIAVVQGNIPQDKKWDANFVESIMSGYESLTKEAVLKDKADLVIWPETSIPGFVEEEEEIFSRIKKLVNDTSTPLLAGAPRYDSEIGGSSYYNSAFLFLKDGTIGGYYDKIHLVPFGEYVPLKSLLSFVHRFAPRPIGDCLAGKDYTVFKLLLTRSARDKDYVRKMIKKVGFSCLICFEDIFPDLARQFAARDIDFLVNITNDAWFGRSAAAYQHAQASVFRAVENRTNVIRAANTGLSCFIDQKGQVGSRVSEDGKDLFVEGYKTSEIILSRTNTFYTRYGDVFVYMCIFFTVLVFARGLKKAI